MKIAICKYNFEISCGPLSFSSWNRSKHTLKMATPFGPSKSHFWRFFSLEVLDVFYPLMVVASSRCLTRFVFLLSKLNFSSLCLGAAPLGLGTAPLKDLQVAFYLTCADIQSRFLNCIFPSWKDSLPRAQCMPKFEPIHRCPTLRNAALRYVLSTPLSLTLVGCSRGPSDSRLQRDGRPQQELGRNGR